ncbi:MAG: hypothetical protein JWR10_483 [Rubritepida sp.]|nr:hypothetical protein [Rubritepida sp.]
MTLALRPFPNPLALLGRRNAVPSLEHALVERKGGAATTAATSPCALRLRAEAVAPAIISNSPQIDNPCNPTPIRVEITRWT